MAFCTHCGAQLPAGARFCTSCGTPVAEKPVNAPSAPGESVLASWSAPKAPKPQASVTQAPAPQAPAPQKPVAANGPMTVKQALEKTKDDLLPKKSKTKWWVWALIAVGVYFLLQIFPIS